MSSPPTPRRYFDNAATSFPKPPTVTAAMARYMNEVGAAGRGGYAEARESARLIHQCRERICRLIGGESARNVVFTLNATDALNMAIKGAARAYSRRTGRTPHAVITDMEHNSVLRPCNEMAADGLLELTRVAADPMTGLVDPDDLIGAIRPGQTAFVAINHASNVTGTVQAIEQIGPRVRGAAAGDDAPLFIVDASQSLGHCPADVRAAAVDLLAFPGHKGLLGPTGTGALYIRPDVEQRIETYREGGTGNVSERDTHPETMPEKFEAGSHNTVGIVGLSEGVAWLLDRGIESIRRHEQTLLAELVPALRAMSDLGVRVLGAAKPASRVGVVTFTHSAYSPTELAMLLETEFGILGRAGLHCAPHVHGLLGTAPPRGEGAMRLSLGPFLETTDVRAATEAVERLSRSAREAQPRLEHSRVTM